VVCGKEAQYSGIIAKSANQIVPLSRRHSARGTKMLYYIHQTPLSSWNVEGLGMRLVWSMTGPFLPLWRGMACETSFTHWPFSSFPQVIGKDSASLLHCVALAPHYLSISMK